MFSSPLPPTASISCFLEATEEEAGKYRQLTELRGYTLVRRQVLVPDAMIDRDYVL
jgi:hypothetical protein